MIIFPSNNHRRVFQNFLLILKINYNCCLHLILVQASNCPAEEGRMSCELLTKSTGVYSVYLD